MFFDRIEAIGVREQFESVVREYGVKLEDIYVDNRETCAVLARRKCMKVLSEQMGKSNEEIGSIFDRTATTVERALRQPEIRYGKSLAMGNLKVAPRHRATPDMTEANFMMLTSMVQELEQLASDVSEEDHDQAMFLAGKAEGVRAVLRIFFPQQPKPEP